MLKKFALASFALVFVLAASGQSQHSGPSFAQRIDSLEQRVSDLELRENGRYQITAVTWNSEVTGGLQFTAVYRVDTRTGNVCQVVSEKVRNGELLGGTSLPYCTQSGPQPTGMERPLPPASAQPNSRDVPMPKCLHYDKYGYCTEFERPNP